MSLKYPAAPALTIGLSLVLAGCGGNSERPPMGKVYGTVTYDGKPVTKGKVTFSPVASEGISGGTASMGLIETDGTYTMTTFDTGDGAIIGQHIVTVTVPAQDINELNQPKADGSIAYVLPKELIPKKYTDPRESPLRNTVAAGNNKIDIDLKK